MDESPDDDGQCIVAKLKFFENEAQKYHERHQFVYQSKYQNMFKFHHFFLTSHLTPHVHRRLMKKNVIFSLVNFNRQIMFITLNELFKPTRTCV